MNLDYLKECVYYNPNTGSFFWRKRPLSHFENQKNSDKFNCKFSGKEITTATHSGYLKTTIDGKRHYLHRMAWFYVHGVWPDSIDHINGNTADNRICNLRNVTHQANLKNCKLSKNNSSGIHGVRWKDHHGKWLARIFTDGKEIHLGSFASFFDACCARKSAEKRFGFHENHGRAVTLR
jgi:hypothetical protein